ncbi:hypothetical protein ACF1BN_22035 [Streptomyces sp. NPDC014861]|uniref:hypothetical protein n=1 Tax=Streptomyces sp. NPDC014861 TaxID=3364923 RepID=UPI0036FC5149
MNGAPTMRAHSQQDIRAADVDLRVISHAERDRLHGRACARCGAPSPHRPAGYAFAVGRDGGRLGWPVRVCSNCPTSGG